MATQIVDKDKRIKLQIPVDRALVETIAELAHRMGRSRSWMTAELLEIVIEQKQHFADWWTWRLINAGVVAPIKAIMRLFGKKKPQPIGKEIVYVQAYVAPELATAIAKWAKQMAQSESLMAAMILRCAVENHGWVIKAVTSRLVTKLGGKPYHAGKQRERITSQESA